MNNQQYDNIQQIAVLKSKIFELDKSKPGIFFILVWMILFFPIGLLLIVLRIVMSRLVSKAEKEIRHFEILQALMQGNKTA